MRGLLALCGLFAASRAAIIDFEADAGGVAEDDSLASAWKNGGLINTTLASLQAGDTLGEL
jgi:hypothetical protein